MGIIQVHYNDFRIKLSKSNLNQYVVIQMMYIEKCFQLTFVANSKYEIIYFENTYNV